MVWVADGCEQREIKYRRRRDCSRFKCQMRPGIGIDFKKRKWNTASLPYEQRTLISILLDGSISEEEIFELLDASYHLTM